MPKNKQKKVKEPQYYSSATNMPTYNYKVYYMSSLEKILYFIIAFAVGAAVGYLFYGGIGKNEYNEPTKTTHILNVVIPSIVGAFAGIKFIPIRTEQIIKKHQKNLKSQFRNFLEALDTAYGAGKNMIDSFYSSYSDLKMQYEEDAHILKELEVILAGYESNIEVEVSLKDLGERSGIEDIRMFADVFAIGNRRGGNMKDIIRNTREILGDKMEIAEDIETTVASSKSEQNVMMCMPIVLVALMKFSDESMASNFTTDSGIVSTTIAVVMFVAAYFIGKKILDIHI